MEQQPSTGELIKMGFWQASGQALFWAIVLLILGILGSFVKTPQPTAPATSEKPKCSA